MRGDVPSLIEPHARFEPLEPRLLLDGSVVINEIHYDPDIKTEPAEYVELYNTTADPIDISHWRFSDGIEFEFPDTTILPGYGYVVVAQNPTTAYNKFGVTAFGPFIGQLENDGERIVLRDATETIVDEVDYGAGFPWPTVGETPGYSIELINPALDNDLAGSWRASVGMVVEPVTLIGDGAEWMYFKGLSEPSPGSDAWRYTGFDETGWTPATLAVGYSSEADEQAFIETVLADMLGNYTTVYFRKEFTVADPGAVPGLELLARYDDGINVWINGEHVLDLNVPGTELPYNATASAGIDNAQFVPNNLPPPSGYLQPGTNCIAVQLLNINLSPSTDAFFEGILQTSTGGSPGATPGEQNSVYSANAPPQMRQVDHSPTQPASGEDATITIKVTDPDGVGSVTLAYQVVEPGDYIAIDDPRYNAPAYWTSGVPMYDDGTHGDGIPGDDVYTAVLPGSVQVHRRLIRYRITATDALGASATGPYDDDPQPNFAYFVYDGVPSWTGSARPGVEPAVEYSSELLESIAVYHLITTNEDHVESQYIPDSTAGQDWSNLYVYQGTLVYDGVVYDHIRYRPRGGVHRFKMGKNMWKFDFNRNHWFQARDDYGEKYDVKWDKLNFSAIIQQGNFGQRGEQGLFEAAGFALHNLAGNMASNTNFVHFRIIEDADENGPDQFSGDFQGLYLALEQPDGRMLEEHDQPDGNFYKMEGGTGTLNNQGPTQPTDKSDLNAFMSGYLYVNNPDATWCEANIDLEDYYTFRAVAMAIHDYDMHAQKNYFYYHNPETGKWSIHNWDLDLCWTTTYNGGGGWGPLYDDNSGTESDVFLLNIPELRIAYNNRVREIVDLLFNPEQTGMLLDEVASFVYTPGQPSFVDADAAMWDYNPIMSSSYINTTKTGPGWFYTASPTDDFAGMVQIQKNYVASRMNAIDPKVSSDEGYQPNTPTLTYTGPALYPGDGLTFESSAYSSSYAGFAAMEWRIAEVTVPGTPEFDPTERRKYEIEADWESGELAAFDPNVTIPSSVVEAGKRYRVRVRMKDTSGRYSHWSDAAEFVAGAPQGSSVPLRITEIMYHPGPRTAAEIAAGFASAEDFEYVEIQNIGPTTLNLAGVRFTNGFEYTFGSTSVASGGTIVVAKNPTAFAFRYPGTSNVVGPFVGGSLSNGGETLRLEDALGSAIHDFEYKAGWFDHTDGEGFSLVVRDAGQDTGLWDSKDGWRASWQHGGNPGQADPSPLNPGDIVINEVLSHQDADPPGDWVELRNTTQDEIDIGGWYLSDDAGDLMKYRIADGTTIAGGGYRLFTEADHFGVGSGAPGSVTGFALSEHEDNVYLTASPAVGVLAGYREDEDFGAIETGVTFGRYIKSTGGKDFVAMSAPTSDDENTLPRVGPVVINEIMYNPLTGHEYIELLNITDQEVLLYDPLHTENRWRFTQGVTFQVPEGASIAPNGYALVVPIDPATFRSTYGIAADVPVWGPYTGGLADEGETLQMERPGTPETDPPFVPYICVDRVTYNDNDPWPWQADGEGSSLNRLVSEDYGNDVANWAPSTVGGTPGGPNISIDYTPPSTPADLSAYIVSDAMVNLSWAAAADPQSGVSRYRIYRNSLFVGESAGLAYNDTDVAAGQFYTYQISAVNGDAVESDLSAPSVSVQIVTAESVLAPDANHVEVTFTHPVTQATAENSANYSLIYGAGNPIGISHAARQPGGTTVSLTLSAPLAAGFVHALTVTGVMAESGSPVVPGCQRTFGYETFVMGSILREWWLGIGSSQVVSALTGHARFPDDPSGSEYVTLFEGPTDWAQEYGTRMRGYVHPPASDDYTFWVSSDDNSELWLSTDADPANKQLIASVPGWSSSRQWDKFASQQSAPQHLLAGGRYYIEVLQKEGSGGDNLAVAWTRPGETPQANGPIPGAYLSAGGGSPAVTVSVTAADPDAAEDPGNTGAFTISRDDTSGAMVVYYTMGGTADAGDYAPAPTNWVELADGVASAQVQVNPIDDAAPESDESVILTITSSPEYGVGQAIATVTIADNDDVPPPQVVSVALNPHPNRTERGVGQIDPGGLGVETVLVTFSKDVTFLPGHVTAEKVTFDALGNEIGTVPVAPESVVYGATNAEILITFADSWQTMVDTWVRITLADTITDGGGQALDGEPRSNSSGLGYIYDSGDDLPSGDGAAGGAAVFYVGSLRADMRGYGPGDVEPDGEITPWDITGFTQKYLAEDLDADMAGYGPGQAEPDTDVNPWDISGFTSRYSAAMAAGTHLEPLPTGGEGLAVGTPAPLPLTADETVSALTAAPEIGLLTRTAAEPAPVTEPASPPANESATLAPSASDDVAPDLLVASGDPAPSTSAPWSPVAPDAPATETPLAADGGLIDLLAAPALEMPLTI
ncbi:MAG TPA: lamin tail domain-containing protein [Phycisphaerae bacterium]|nr:lamin tail domain-containing protein [Phycisphaerae bacterium]